jgi:non-canonical (house-cleaning) NTP pyrophosphatase/predicted phosphatase
MSNQNQVLCIFDFDETLSNKTRVISEQVKKNLCLWQEKYNLVYALASFYDKADNELIKNDVDKYFKYVYCGYDKWNGSKVNMINEIISKSNFDYENVIFFDDLDININNVKKYLPIHCVKVDSEHQITDIDFEKAYHFVNGNKCRKIFVGTTNQDKIAAVRNVLLCLNITCQIIDCNVTSGVSDQPIGDEETTIGAGNRAHAALKSSDNKNDYAIGIETGIIKGLRYENGTVKEQYYDQTIVVLVDNHGNTYTGKGPAIPVPYDNLENYSKRINKINNKVTEYYTKSLLTRTSSCEFALRSILSNII